MTIGQLHRNATDWAMEQLGPGATSRRFLHSIKRELMKLPDLYPDLLDNHWGGREGWAEDTIDFMQDFGGKSCVRPDAFRISTDELFEVTWYQIKEPLVFIDIIEIEGSWRFANKFEAYSHFADIIENSDYLTMRIRMFSEHREFLGQLNEGKIMYEINK